MRTSLVATAVLSSLILAASTPAQDLSTTTPAIDQVSAAPGTDQAPDLGLIGDIVLSDEEAFLDLAANAELAWELVLDALLELEYDVDTQLYRHPDENWIRVDDLWIAVESVPYLRGEWSRVRVRVGEFITDIDRGWSEVLLLQIAHRFDERLLETLIGEADLADDGRFVDLGEVGTASWVEPGGVPYNAGPDLVQVDLTVNAADCYAGYGYGYGYGYPFGYPLGYWGKPWVVYGGYGCGPIASWGWSSYNGWPFWDVSFGYGLPLFWHTPYGHHYGHHDHPHHHDDPYHHHDDHYDDYGGNDDGLADGGPGTGDFDADPGGIGTIVMDDPVAPQPGEGWRGRPVDVGGDRGAGFIGRPEIRKTTTIPVARRGTSTPSSVTKQTLFTPRGTRITTLDAPRRPSLPGITSTSTRGSDRTLVASTQRGTPIFGTPRASTPTSSTPSSSPRAPSSTVYTRSTPRSSSVRTGTPVSSLPASTRPTTSVVATPKVSKPRVSKPPTSSTSTPRVGKSTRGSKRGKN